MISSHLPLMISFGFPAHLSRALQALLQHPADAQLVANLDSESFGISGVAASDSKIILKTWNFNNNASGFFLATIVLMQEILHQLIASLSHYLSQLFFLLTNHPFGGAGFCWPIHSSAVLSWTLMGSC